MAGYCSARSESGHWPTLTPTPTSCNEPGLKQTAKPTHQLATGDAVYTNDMHTATRATRRMRRSSMHRISLAAGHGITLLASRLSGWAKIPKHFHLSICKRNEK